MWLAAAFIFFLAGMYLLGRRFWIGFLVTLCLMFVSGAFLIQVLPPPVGEIDSFDPGAKDRESVVTGHVIRESVVQQEGAEDVQKIDLTIDEINVANITTKKRFGLRLTVFNKISDKSQATRIQQPTTFHYGDGLCFPVKLSFPHNFQNPGAFDYVGYLAESGISLIGSAKIADIQVLPGFSGNRFELWRTRIHRSLIEKIHTLWPGENAALVDTILLGDDTFLGRATRTNFQRTGTYHVLVVSSLKVGILALVIFFCLRKLRFADFAASLLTLLITVCYALLTDVGTPVWRATLMLFLYFATRMLYRKRSILNTVGGAALVLLVIDPNQLFGASFQLSFLCALIIGGIASPLIDRTTKTLSRGLRNLDSVRYDLALSPPLAQMRLDLRLISGRFQQFAGRKLPLIAIAGGGRLLILVFEFVIISVLLQASFALPMAYYFHRAAVVSLPANILIVPLTEILMAFASLSIFIGYISVAVARIPSLLTAAVLTATQEIVHRLGSLRIADQRVATPQMWIAALTCAGMILAMILIRRRWLVVAGVFAFIAATAIWISFVPPNPKVNPGILEVTAIDVGQGDAILIVFPEGKTLLVDAGGLPEWMHSDLDIGEDVVSPYLWWRGISHLDDVMITHPHADHIGGMSAVLANFRPGEMWLGVNSPSPQLQYLRRQAKEMDVSVIQHFEGQKFNLGGATVRVLAPPAGLDQQVSRPNDTSLVIKIIYKRTSVLLEGDAERKEEDLILREDDPRADLLKVGHHGSNTSTDSEFLAAVRPRLAVISVGARNVYGHPRKEVLDRLANLKIGTYRTDINGAVSFYLDGKNVIPETSSYH